jgi:hypothetical protein
MDWLSWVGAVTLVFRKDWLGSKTAMPGTATVVGVAGGVK